MTSIRSYTCTSLPRRHTGAEVGYDLTTTAGTFHEILKPGAIEPFRVVMSSGEGYNNVMHPAMAFVTAKALVPGTPEPSHPDGERLAFCSYLHVAHAAVPCPPW
jgi:hypothetical protein